MRSIDTTTIPFVRHAVARIGYGAMQLTHGGDVSPSDAVALLRLAIESGVNHIDTAEFYGAGTANRFIREALGPYPDRVVVATKIGADNTPDGRLAPAQRPDELRRQVEANLASLGAERLDLVYVRRLDAAPGIVAEGEQLVDLDDQLAVLVELRDQGKIDAIGLSQVSVDQLRQALPAGIAAVQNLYNLLDRSSEPVLDVVREHGIAWVPYFPLGSGFAGRRKVTEDATVLDLARELGATASQIGLAWLLARYDRTLLIPGTTRADHLAENLGAATVELGAKEMARLDGTRG